VLIGCLEVPRKTKTGDLIRPAGRAGYRFIGLQPVYTAAGNESDNSTTARNIAPFMYKFKVHILDHKKAVSMHWPIS
jgi:hypothetical protein